MDFLKGKSKDLSQSARQHVVFIPRLNRETGGGLSSSNRNKIIGKVKKMKDGEEADFRKQELIIIMIIIMIINSENHNY